jgi:hypothetical protein
MDVKLTRDLRQSGNQTRHLTAKNAKEDHFEIRIFLTLRTDGPHKESRGSGSSVRSRASKHGRNSFHEDQQI